VPKPKADLLLHGAGEIVTCIPAGSDKAGRHRGAAGGDAVAVAGERVAAIAPLGEIERDWDLSGARRIDLASMILAPGFVDCHTHLVFGGSRALEYAARLTRTREETEALGIPTGIQATVAMTRAADGGELERGARAALARMFRHGSTTVESKSGYGLRADKELAILEVNRRLQGSQPVDIVPTFLGAHDFPQELGREDYLRSLLDDMIPRVAGLGLARFCDVYCDEGYYTAEEARLILEAGRRHGLDPKMHLDAYSNIGGAAVATGLRAVSVDHLNYTKRTEMAAMAAAGVVGVVMPGLDFAVRHPRPFDARSILSEGMTLALATDFCPACWMESMQLVMQLACRSYGLSAEEALVAATAGAAKALALDDRGYLAPGALADLQIWNIPSFEDIVYRFGNNAVAMVVKRGRVHDFRGGRQ
jgi:imidazolonepropionase